MQARYAARHYEDAVTQGTMIWRDFIGDPDAELPWDASIRVEIGSEDVETDNGSVIARTPVGEAVLTVKTSITQD